MQNILDVLQHAMLTFILCVRNAFELVKYRATYITYALSADRHAHAHLCVCTRARARTKEDGCKMAGLPVS